MDIKKHAKNVTVANTVTNKGPKKAFFYVVLAVIRGKIKRRFFIEKAVQTLL